MTFLDELELEEAQREIRIKKYVIWLSAIFRQADRVVHYDNY